MRVLVVVCDAGVRTRGGVRGRGIDEGLTSVQPAVGVGNVGQMAIDILLASAGDSVREITLARGMSLV
jgi:hypothetical protein